MPKENEAITALKEVRQKLVNERRELVKVMQTASETLASTHAPAFAELQDAIDAIDRAVTDEKKQNPPPPQIT